MADSVRVPSEPGSQASPSAADASSPVGADPSREALPTIYGFNNGGSPGYFYGCLIAEDGTPLGSHMCSNEHFMLGDLGITPGSRPDRHETFSAHYPGGYRMAFVSYRDVPNHAGLQRALAAASAIEAREGHDAQRHGAEHESAVPTGRRPSPSTLTTPEQ